MREFEKEVKGGRRTGLSADEVEATSALRPGYDVAKEKAEKEKEKEKKPKGKDGKAGRATGVKQAKVVRQSDRVDPLTGKGRSKGYGFLELDSHADALRVLRWANNSREANGLMWGWWRDEVADLVKRGKEEIAAASKPAAAGAADEAEGGAEGAKEKGKPKGGKKAVEGEDLEARVKKLEARLVEMKDRDAEASIKDGRTLHIEFSVENITVVKRRHDKEVSHGKGGDKHVSVVKAKGKVSVIFPLSFRLSCGRCRN